MKKLLLPICAVLMCMTSCQKDGNDILTLVMEDYSSDAKLHLDNDNYTVWDNGDSVWLNREPMEVTVSGSKATINCDVSDNIMYNAIYPYSWARGGSGTLEMTGVEYPSTQKYEEVSTGIQKVVAPMAGVCNGSESTLKFHNLGSIIAVNVTNNKPENETLNVRKIEVIADGNVMLWGKYTITFRSTHESTCSIEPASGGSGGNKVTLDCGSGVSVANGSNKTFYIAVPPVTAKLMVKVYDADNPVWCYAKAQETALPLERSHGYYAGITIGSETNQIQYGPEPNQIMYTTTNGDSLSRNWDNESSSPVFFGACTTRDAAYKVEGNWFLTCQDRIETIPEDSFKKNLQITSVTFPNTVTFIGHHSFNGCTNLKTVHLGSGITEIRGSSFEQCTSLTNVYCTQSSAIEFEKEDEMSMHPGAISNIFVGVPSTATLHLPSGIETNRYNAWKEAWWFDREMIDDYDWREITIERPILTDL